MKSKLEEALEKIEPKLSIHDKVKIKIEVKKSMVLSSVEKLKTEFEQANENYKRYCKTWDEISYVFKHGGFIVVSQHIKIEIKSGFTAIEELILEDVPMQAFKEEPKKLLLGDVLYSVAENGIMTFIKANYDSTDSGRYNNRF